MKPKFATELNRDRRGRICNSVSLEVVALMFADWNRTKSVTKTAANFNCSSATMYRLLVSRGFMPLRPKELPRAQILQMYFGDYIAGRMSLEQVADKHGRTRQSVFGVFKLRGLRLRKKEFLPFVVHKGRKYTAQKSRGHDKYLRCTTGRKRGEHRYLHHSIWIEHNGPIPEGYKVCFIDGNHLNCDVSNLELLSNSDQPRKHATGANQFTKTADVRLESLLTKSANVAGQLKERAA